MVGQPASAVSMRRGCTAPSSAHLEARCWSCKIAQRHRSTTAGRAEKKLCVCFWCVFVVVVGCFVKKRKKPAAFAGGDAAAHVLADRELFGGALDIAVRQVRQLHVRCGAAAQHNKGPCLVDARHITVHLHSTQLTLLRLLNFTFLEMALPWTAAARQQFTSAGKNTGKTSEEANWSKSKHGRAAHSGELMTSAALQKCSCGASSRRHPVGSNNFPERLRARQQLESRARWELNLKINHSCCTGAPCRPLPAAWASLRRPSPPRQPARRPCRPPRRHHWPAG